jgi:4-hydroxy-tetrahydrodipicolinate reductase
VTISTSQGINLMMKVAVSGATGRLGAAITRGISNANDMQLTGVYAPGHAGEVVEGLETQGSAEKMDAEILVECAPSGVVMDNLKMWHAKGMSTVVGTSGFTESRMKKLRSFWGEDDPACLVVPNFSIGAVLMMRFAERASVHFDSAEIIERHEETKPDAPSGTALATAVRVGKSRSQSEINAGDEIVKGARGGLLSGVRVHSLRMKGLLSDQEVAFSNLGETFSINHRSTSYDSFVNGALLAIRHVRTRRGVAMGLDEALNF